LHHVNDPAILARQNEPSSEVNEPIQPSTPFWTIVIVTTERALDVGTEVRVDVRLRLKPDPCRFDYAHVWR
jgi:hypothetical protein